MELKIVPGRISHHQEGRDDQHSEHRAQQHRNRKRMPLHHSAEPLPEARSLIHSEPRIQNCCCSSNQPALADGNLCLSAPFQPRERSSERKEQLCRRKTSGVDSVPARPPASSPASGGRLPGARCVPAIKRQTSCASKRPCRSAVPWKKSSARGRSWNGCPITSP